MTYAYFMFIFTPTSHVHEKKLHFLSSFSYSNLSSLYNLQLFQMIVYVVLSLFLAFLLFGFCLL